MRFLSFFALVALSGSVESIERSINLNVESPVIASRDGTEISMFDIHGRMMQVPSGDRAGFVSSPERLENLITELLTVHFLANRARQDNMDKTQDFEAELHYMMTVGLAENYRDQWLDRRMLDSYENQAREMYLLDSERFRLPPTVTFRHILIRDYRPEARDRASEILDRITGGESFSDLAMALSDDPSVVQNSGFLEAIDSGTLEEQFAAGISELSIGDPSLIQSGFGWHVVVVEERVEGRKQSFEEVQARLEAQARTRHRDQLTERLLREAYAGDLMLVEGAVAEILERYPPPEDLIEAIESSN